MGGTHDSAPMRNLAEDLRLGSVRTLAGDSWHETHTIPDGGLTTRNPRETRCGLTTRNPCETPTGDLRLETRAKPGGRLATRTAAQNYFYNYIFAAILFSK